MEARSIPRICASMLPTYVGRVVIIVGKVLELRGESALLDANGEVDIILNIASRLTTGNAAQIIGKINPDLSVKVYQTKDLGNNVDLEIAQMVVEITHKYKEVYIFDEPDDKN
ncbi:replication factor A protein 3 [Xylaria scruposa]|nr:replication factor A protein 3 [Xylaria scruposa]